MNNYWEQLLDKAKANHLNLDFDKIKLALGFAEESHQGQYRKSGDDYIIHPVEVAKILMDMKMDTDTIVAGLLHDVVEDTLIPIADIKYNFGDTVATLVDGVTKLKTLPNGTKNQAENIRKMILAMAENIRVILIKLADRLHNMRTLKFMKPEKQQSISKETLDIYAPLAHRLGMAKIKSELEDIAFSYLHHDEFLEIKRLVDNTKEERKDYIENFIRTIIRTLSDLDIKAEVKGRFKHFYSIYKKMYQKGKEFDDIYDLMGVRVIVEDKATCYHVLGIVHSQYTPVPGRFKDYIAVPKSNNYQSIHTTIVGPLGKFIEIQIRTKDMDDIAEEGIAAHWNYKENKKSSKDDNIYGWLRHIIEFQNESDSTEDFIEGVTGDIDRGTVFTFSPKGDIIELPVGATALDFAFMVHTQVGCKCVGAKVNGRMVTIDHKLKSGDKVEIITSKNSKGPSIDWLDIVVTHGAKGKIRKFLKDENKETVTKIGKDNLEKEASKLGMTLKELENDLTLKKHMEKNNIPNLEEFYFYIGEKRSRLDVLITKIKTSLEKERAASTLTIEEVLKKKEEKKKEGKNDFGIVIDGINNTLIRFAKCCTPLPGDDIGGFVTKLTGITVHRKDCPNFHAMVEKDPSREILVKWDENLIETKMNKYNFTFTVVLNDRPNILMEIVNLIANHKINITSVNSYEVKKDGDRIVKVKISIEIKAKTEYDYLINNILKLKDVISVER
ncbi:bifunctional (p)ppGpp synthetase/guanosine-3',5'-bis(diphosphate) 3'-pyrophosphohydrolase [Fusobacterium nucleatum subsp. nucleatum ATCC 23726]|uniref:Guanosine-3',5'-bis(Diphosphate) 3'-pyrophosphohydrolase n=3 Tax=Fusobacterium nucleatum subsp. nucleatum TaxID=76856 RepID=Q8R5V7_FUSNN|nr:bifunctional (p)ppGpp synthetase/guanosine-3',5'-bis(diphosphate) 3'-pyrophosphohydrolase [Fusobacterium nucleatum]AAL95675.1 Guanosine-3',5'-bis(Diphosphate) 3'-pyrophosphohydrolase [Fusobacterium nucleatum subsp. nucleatum ATCC 25586]ALF22952.1 guanosine-3',5'-bis(diphosphate) 3'-pyrophosphohydrolase [Fusobacterium nucleatum subsp. nucleatum ChDC F316]ALF25907.1 guanosine-3',5'-bis(diphosphate) 3'-pyrophosphohydrolase [Fusobacterium nucleatum subsp. nucleatum]ASG25868.1 bifunctional (p)ppG